MPHRARPLPGNSGTDTFFRRERKVSVPELPELPAKKGICPRICRQAVLAVHPGALGDVVLFGHLLAATEGRATLVAGGEKVRLLVGMGVVAAGLDFDSLPMHEVFSDAPAPQCRLPGLLGGHDRLISCFAGGDARAERRLAELCGVSDAAYLPTRPPAGFDGHLTDLWAGMLNMPQPLPTRPWAVPPAWREQAARALGGLGVDVGRAYVAIHPGAGAEAKCWPLEGFLDVAAGLRRKGAQAVFLLGPVERDRWRDGRIERLGRDGPVLAEASAEELAGVLAGAAAYAGNDSGTSHLAAAVGTPTVAIFGATSPVHFRPLGPRVQTIAADRLADIPPGRVLDALAIS